MVITCRELAKIFDIAYLQASSMVKMLLKTGAASELDSVRGKGRGRPTIEYSIPSMATINFATGEVEQVEGILNADKCERSN